MALDPFVVRTADPLDEDQELAADLLAGFGPTGVGSAKAQFAKLLWGALGVGTMVTTGAGALPVDERYTVTGRDPVRLDLTNDNIAILFASDIARLGGTIQNPSAIDVYVGFTDQMTTTGATTGIVIKANQANGSFQVPANYRGNVYVRRTAGGTGAYVIGQAI